MGSGVETRCTQCKQWSDITSGRCPCCETMTQSPETLARWDRYDGEFAELIKYPDGQRIVQCKGCSLQLERFQGHTDEFTIELVGYEVLRGVYDPSSHPQWKKHLDHISVKQGESN